MAVFTSAIHRSRILILYCTLDHRPAGASNNLKHGRDEDSADKRLEKKIARCEQRVDVSAGAKPASEDSSVTWTRSDLQAVVSELAGEMRGFKGHVVALLGDIAARPDHGIFTRNTVPVKDSACKHCCGRR